MEINISYGVKMSLTVLWPKHTVIISFFVRKLDLMFSYYSETNIFLWIGLRNVWACVGKVVDPGEKILLYRYASTFLFPVPFKYFAISVFKVVILCQSQVVCLSFSRSTLQKIHHFITVYLPATSLIANIIVFYVWMYQNFFDTDKVIILRVINSGHAKVNVPS